MEVFLPEFFLAHIEPDSLACEVGKALDPHLESLPWGLTHISNGLYFFCCCLPGAQRYRHSVLLSKCLGVWKFSSPPSLSKSSLYKHFPFRELGGYWLSWPFSQSSDYGPRLFILVHLVCLTERWALESGWVSIIPLTRQYCEQESNLTSPCVSFIICKMEIILPIA